MRLVRKIIIPNFLREFKVSEARRATYFIMKPGEEVKIPKKYQDPSQYGFLKLKRGKNIIDVLCLLENKEKVIKNPLSVGTPRWIKINFQKIWDNSVADATRNKMAILLKESYQEALSQIEPITSGFPLKTSFTVHSKNEGQDVDNLTIIYVKTFHDALTEAKIIPDDSLKYLKRYEAGHEESETNYLEIDIYSYDNEEAT